MKMMAGMGIGKNERKKALGDGRQDKYVRGYKESNERR